MVALGAGVGGSKGYASIHLYSGSWSVDQRGVRSTEGRMRHAKLRRVL